MRITQFLFGWIMIMMTIPYLIAVTAFVVPTEPFFTHKVHSSKHRHHYAPPRLENCQELVSGQKPNQDFILSIDDDDEIFSIEDELQMMMFDYLQDQGKQHRQSWITLTLQVIVNNTKSYREWNQSLQNCGWSLLQSSDNKYVIDPPKFVQHTLRNAISSSLTYHKRLTALRILAFLLSKPQALSFDFSSNSNNNISYQPSILPSTIVQKLNEIMIQIKQNGWLSTNPDSVDSLPSLHLNIISDGHLIFQSEDENEYPKLIRQMHTLLEPYLIDTLLPQAQQKLGDENIQISDVFIRSYGQNVIPDNDDECGSTRFGLSEHYDITAAATCVMALDDVASHGTSGLYTIVDNECTHKALKQFFPIQAGDGVIHTWDILHGVDIDPSHQRTSLIVWFTKTNSTKSKRNESDDVPYWLRSQNNNDNDVIQKFVLALSKEQQQHPQDEIIDLIIESASLGNNFALTRLGTLLMDQVDNHDSIHYDDESELMKMNSKHIEACHSLVNLLGNNGYQELSDRETNNKMDWEKNVMIQRKIAIALLKEASLRGSAIAQVSYADALMEEYFMEYQTDKRKEELMMDAAILLTLASQQDYKPARESIQRLSSLYHNIFFTKEIVETTTSREEIQNDFLQSNIMQVIQSNTPDNFVDYIRDFKIP